MNPRPGASGPGGINPHYEDFEMNTDTEITEAMTDPAALVAMMNTDTEPTPPPAINFEDASYVLYLVNASGGIPETHRDEYTDILSKITQSRRAHRAGAYHTPADELVWITYTDIRTGEQFAVTDEDGDLWLGASEAAEYEILRRELAEHLGLLPNYFIYAIRDDMPADTSIYPEHIAEAFDRVRRATEASDAHAMRRTA